jgi:hypothetical protein
MKHKLQEELFSGENKEYKGFRCVNCEYCVVFVGTDFEDLPNGSKHLPEQKQILVAHFHASLEEALLAFRVWGVEDCVED